MTGFARTSGSFEGCAYAWEIKSVNGKALDVRLRLPSGFDHLEIPTRQAVAQNLKRGNLQINLTLDEANAADGVGVQQLLVGRHDLGANLIVTGNDGSLVILHILAPYYPA